MCLPGVCMLTKFSSDSRKIAVCIALSCGAPAFAPIGTSGATARGAPFCLVTGGSAEMIMVGIPASSIAL